MAQNKVIAGDYEGKNIMIGQQSFFSKEEVFLFTGLMKKFINCLCKKCFEHS